MCAAGLGVIASSGKEKERGGTCSSFEASFQLRCSFGSAGSHSVTDSPIGTGCTGWLPAGSFAGRPGFFAARCESHVPGGTSHERARAVAPEGR